jgi:hypothetical protein
MLPTVVSSWLDVFWWWTILDTQGKMSVKNPAVFQFMTQTGAPGTYNGLRKYPPLCSFPILMPYNLELNRFWGVFVSFNFHNMPTTLKMQNHYFCEANKK